MLAIIFCIIFSLLIGICLGFVIGYTSGVHDYTALYKKWIAEEFLPNKCSCKKEKI